MTPRVHQAELVVASQGRGFVDLTARVQAEVARSGVRLGTCQLFIQHTSASLLLTERADPSVRVDLENAFARVFPDGDPRYTHTLEGPDDMSAHLRAAATQTSLLVPVTNAELSLGIWQGLYLWEHRFAAHPRTIVATIMGTT